MVGFNLVSNRKFERPNILAELFRHEPIRSIDLDSRYTFAKQINEISLCQRSTIRSLSLDNWKREMLAVPIASLEKILNGSVTYLKAKEGQYRRPVCVCMSALLATELKLLDVPYRVVQTTRAPGNANDDLIHMSLRVWVKDVDGSNKWMIVDPTMGQWFKNGTIDRKGNFVEDSAVVNRANNVSAIFIGTHDDLRNAVAKNITNLAEKSREPIEKIHRLANPDRAKLRFGNSHSEQAQAFVEYVFGQPNDVGLRTNAPPGTQRNAAYEKVEGQLRTYYRLPQAGL